MNTLTFKTASTKSNAKRSLVAAGIANEQADQYLTIENGKHGFYINAEGAPQTIELVNTPVVEPVVTPSAPAATDRKGYKIEKHREYKNAVKKPSVGTKCHDIWLKLDATPDITVKQLAKFATDNGWNKITVTRQYYDWAKFYGKRK